MQVQCDTQWWPVFDLSKVSVNERRLYICNVFSHWLRPYLRKVSANERRCYICKVFSHRLSLCSACSAIDRKQAKSKTPICMEMAGQVLKHYRWYGVFCIPVVLKSIYSVCIWGYWGDCFLSWWIAAAEVTVSPSQTGPEPYDVPQNMNMGVRKFI